MKIIKIILFGLMVVSLIVLAAAVIFVGTFDTHHYLSQIAKKASLATGRPVSIGNVGLGLSLRGIFLDAGPVTIADDPDFTSQPFIKIDNVRISLDLRDLILRREFRITHILLQSPEIHIIRSWEGDFNARSILQEGKRVNRHPENNPAILRVAKDLNKINSIRESLPLGPGMTKDENKELSSIKIQIQDASISYIDQNQAFPVDIWLRGINASLHGFSQSKSFQISSDACFYSNVPNMHLSALMSLDLSKYSVALSGLNLDTDFSKLDIDALKGVSINMPDSSLFKNISGILHFNLTDLNFTDSGEFKANGKMSITSGVIKNLNIFKTVLSHTLGAFGGIEDHLEGLLNGQLKDKLDTEDTIISKAEVEFSLHDKTVYIDDSQIQTNIFEFEAKGSVDEGLNTDLQTILRLNNDVSAALVNELEGLKYLMDDSQRIAIDATLKGVIPHLKYKPNKDFRKKSKKFLIEEGGNILNILFK